MTDDVKSQLLPADENVWYCLATVYGEQEEKQEQIDDGPISFFDENLARKNRVAWNRWMAVALSEQQRAELIKKGFDASELAPFSKQERTDFLNVFATRTIANAAPPPDPEFRINFRDVRFKRQVSFENFVFPEFVQFDRAAFDDTASFDKAAFFDNAYFEKAVFSDCANFKDTVFFGIAVFRGAVFSGNANFKDTAFSRMADFLRAVFSGAAHFSRAVFSGTADFSEAAFSDTADFTACEFKSHTYFAGAKFRSHAPDFRDAKLREVTEWRDIDWPPSPKDAETADQQVAAYERLKAEMERLKKHEDEQSFFAKELRARGARSRFKCCDEKRGRGERAKSAFGWLLNLAYGFFSCYGLSIGRPLFGLLAIFALGAVAFAMIPSLSHGPIDPLSAATLSATNLLPLLPYKADEHIIACLKPLARPLGNAQFLLGVVLLFLLGLALRNRFRMK